MKVPIMRISCVLVKIWQIPHVIFKPQVSFSSNFAPLFSVMKYNSTVLFLSQTLYALHTNQSARFLGFLVLRTKFTKFLSFMKQKISFSSNFAPPFGIMRHVSAMLFIAETWYTFRKSSLSEYKFSDFSTEQSKVWNFALWWAPFVKII